MIGQENKGECKMPRRPFINYKNNYFVESGTFQGDGVKEALLNGFKYIFSYEVYEPIYLYSKNRFKDYPDIKILFKSSITMMDEIKDINEPITFWLDGHYSRGMTSWDPNCVHPLLKELEVISQHHIKNHTICIDDRRLLKKTNFIETTEASTDFEVTEEEVIQALYKINPKYNIEYKDGAFSLDVIIASPPFHSIL